MLHSMMQVIGPNGLSRRARQRNEYRHWITLPDDERVRPRNLEDIDEPASSRQATRPRTSKALIVFSDEVVGCSRPRQPLTNIDIIENARLKLHDEGSAIYNMSGEWSGGTCIDRFGPSQVTVSEFSSHRGLRYRLTDATARFYAFWPSEDGRSEYWARRDSDVATLLGFG